MSFRNPNGQGMSNAERQRQHRIREQQKREMQSYLIGQIERLEDAVKLAAANGDVEAAGIISKAPQNVIGGLIGHWMERADKAKQAATVEPKRKRKRYAKVSKVPAAESRMKL